MRFKGTLLKGLFIALAVVLIPVTAVSAQKITPGNACKVLNQKIVYQNKSYTCTKSGKKLVWNKGVTVKKEIPVPTPTVTKVVTPSPTPTPSSTPSPSPSSNAIVDDVQKIIDEIRRNALGLQYSSSTTFNFVFQSPTSSDVEEKTKRSLLNAIPVFAKLGFPITDGLILVAKDNIWLKEELIKNECNVNYTFPDSTGFYVAKSCKSGNGAVTSKHWDVLKFPDGLDGLYFNHTIPHEYFHQIQSQLTFMGSHVYPRWFYEGSAQFFTNQAWVSWNTKKSYVEWHDYWWTVLNANYGPRVCKNATIQKMSDPFETSTDGICAYSKGQLMVEYLIYKYGLEKYRDLYKLNTSPDWKKFNVVFKLVTNNELDDFYLEAEQFMIKRGW